MKFLTTTLVFGFLASTASAQVAEAPTPQRTPGTCSISAQMRIVSRHFLVGSTVGEGTGAITCDYNDGGKEVIPVYLRMNLGGVGFGFSEKTAQFVVGGAGLAPAGARDLLGRYTLTQGSSQVGAIGTAAGLALNIQRDGGFSIPATLGFSEGMGLDGSVDTGSLDIYPMPPPQQQRAFPQRYQQAPAEQPAPIYQGPLETDNQAY